MKCNLTLDLSCKGWEEAVVAEAETFSGSSVTIPLIALIFSNSSWDIIEQDAPVSYQGRCAEL